MAEQKLNKDQLKAVNKTEGPVLIIAGPGSGKTSTLVERVCALLIDKQIASESIFISTFTEKAAKELVTKISNRLLEMKADIDVNSLCIGTMHSILLNLLEEFRDYTRLKRNYTLWDQFDQRYILYKQLYRFSRIDKERIILGKKGGWWEQAGNLLERLNKISEEAIDCKKLRKGKDIETQVLGELYNEYEKLLKEQNAIDFSTIQIEFLRLLEEHPEVRKKLQERFKYIMIDEYQDTNTIQEMILLKILNDKNNICVVGDDDQGLYRFRGATIRNILEFEKNFPKGKCTKIYLTKNYRSHPKIIEYYNDWMRLIDWDKFRFYKTVEPGLPIDSESYRAVQKVSADGVEAWTKEVGKYLITLKKKKIITDWNQVVFLFKSVSGEKPKALARYLEDELDADIKVYSPRSNMFFERTEVRMMIGALCIIGSEYYETPNYPPEYGIYIDNCVREFKNYLKENKVSESELVSFISKKRKEMAKISGNLDYAFSTLFYQLLEYPVFADYLEENAFSSIIDGRPARNLAIFSQLLTKFENLENISIFTKKNIKGAFHKFLNSYLSFLWNGGIGEYEDEKDYAPSGCVSFMTIHQSKGLEFPIVFVCSLWDVPKKQYTELDEILQEKYYRKPAFEPLEETKNYDFWRLYYTAFSRAQNILCLSCPEKKGQGRTPSKYFTSDSYPFVYDKLVSWNKIKKEEWDNVTLSKVKKSNIKNEYSFTSHIIVYETCPLQYKFYKELDFSPVRQGSIIFGTLVHQTIEDVHKAVLNGEMNKINEEQIRDWFHLNYENLRQKEHSFLAEAPRETAVQEVLAYVNREKGRWDRLREAEVPLSLVEEGYILKGQIDLVRNDKGRIDIVDFKSEKKPDLEKEKGRIEQYRRQLEIYAHLVEGKYGEKVDNMHIYYTGADEDENPYLTFKKDSSKIDKTIQDITKTVKKIENKDYSMTKKNRNLKRCQECDLRFYCDRHCSFE